MSLNANVATTQPRRTRSQTTRSLKWELNLNRPISRLPYEVLLLIFEWVFVAYTEAKERIDGFWRRYPISKDGPLAEDNRFAKLGWVPICQVCHRWREAAYGTPTFWSKIYVEDGRCRQALELLKRSWGTQLTVYIDFRILDTAEQSRKSNPVVLFRSTLEQVRKHLVRCRKLTLVPCQSEEGINDIETYLSDVPMPHLRSFVVPGLNAVEISLGLSDMMLGGVSLTTLEVHSVWFDWNTPIIRQLTKLKLDCHPEDIPFPLFMDYLALMPSLRELDIEIYTFPLKRSDLDAVRAHPLNKNPLNLTHLRVVTYSTLQPTALLSAIAPGSLRWFALIAFYMEGECQADFVTLFTSFTTALDTLNHPIRSYTYVIPTPDGITIRGAGNTSQKSFVRSRDDRSTVLEVFVQQKQPDAALMASLLHSAAKHLPTGTLQVLAYLNGGHNEGNIDWCTTFGLVPTLTTVYIQGLSITGFLESLRREDTFGSLDTVGCYLWPSSSNRRSLGLIRESLTARYESGRGIDYFILKGLKGLTDADEEALRLLVNRLYLERVQ